MQGEVTNVARFSTKGEYFPLKEHFLNLSIKHFMPTVMNKQEDCFYGLTVVRYNKTISNNNFVLPQSCVFYIVQVSLSNIYNKS